MLYTGEDGTLWDLCTKFIVLIRILEKVYKFHDFHFSFFTPGDVPTS